MTTNYEQFTFEIPATPFLVDMVGWLIIFSSLLTVGTMGIAAAQQVKTRTLNKVRHEFGVRGAKEVEARFPY
jgi:hypothetical protein